MPQLRYTFEEEETFLILPVVRVTGDQRLNGVLSYETHVCVTYKEKL